MSPRIRPVRPGDAPGVLAVQREAAEERWLILTQPEEVATVEEEEARIASWTPATGTLLVAEDGEPPRIVGICGVHRGRRKGAQHSAEVGITVAASHRGRGVGRALMLAAEEWARAHGIERMHLSVFAHNEPARRLYRALGYAEEGLRPAHYRMKGRDVDEVLMGKRL